MVKNQHAVAIARSVSVPRWRPIDSGGTDALQKKFFAPKSFGNNYLARMRKKSPKKHVHYRA